MEKDDLIYWTRRAYEKGLSPAQSGNVSLLDDTGNILITASGSAAGDIWTDDIVKINFEGEILEGHKKPSSEKFLHIEIYKKRPDIRAIIHSHSPEIAAFALCGKSLNKAAMPEFAFHFGSVPIAKYSLPGSVELAEDVSNLFEDKNVVLMKNHGIIVGAKNLKEAFYFLESIQAYCKACLYAKVLGHISFLSKKEINEIEKLKN